MRTCLDFRSDEGCRIGKVIEMRGEKYKIVEITEAFIVSNSLLRAYVTIEKEETT